MSAMVNWAAGESGRTRLDELYDELAERKYLPELEEYADAHLTIQERLSIYLGISGVYGQCIDSADADRCEALYKGLKRNIKDYADYYSELHGWMMDNARMEFAEYLAKEGY